MPTRSLPPPAAYARRFAVFLALWLIIAGPGAWIVGLLAAGLVAHVSLRLQPARLSGILRAATLAPGFFWASFLGGLDVIGRAFHPRMPLNPGWIIYRSRLSSSGARVALGSDLSLMPGTLAAGGQGELLYIHCLDVDQAVGSQIAREERRVGQSTGQSIGQSIGQNVGQSMGAEDG
ncbi:MAG TPA: Na+/H+ antiporter subunit E [Aestuariivirgaceae bacterium]|nr:Na+/H+ antiporter subunit E [Aestuariivirgaceae bacterium]